MIALAQEPSRRMPVVGQYSESLTVRFQQNVAPVIYRKEPALRSRSCSRMAQSLFAQNDRAGKASALSSGKMLGPLGRE
jgi:hypothetical protein